MGLIVKNGLSNTTKEQEGWDQLRNDVKSDHWGKFRCCLPSHGHHMMIMQPCTTQAPHWWTWDLRTCCLQFLVAKDRPFVADYVKGCDLCNHTKTYLASPSGKLMPN